MLLYTLMNQIQENKTECFCFVKIGFLSNSPGCLGTSSVDQVGSELRDPTASASQMLGIKGICLPWPAQEKHF